MKLRLTKAATEADKARVREQMEADQEKAQDRLDKIKEKYE